MAIKKLVPRSNGVNTPRPIQPLLGQLKPCSKCQVVHSRKSELCWDCQRNQAHKKRKPQINIRENKRIQALKEEYEVSGYTVVHAGILALEFLQTRAGRQVVAKLMEAAEHE